MGVPEKELPVREAGGGTIVGEAVVSSSRPANRSSAASMAGIAKLTSCVTLMGCS